MYVSGVLYSSTRLLSKSPAYRLPMLSNASPCGQREVAVSPQSNPPATVVKSGSPSTLLAPSLAFMPEENGASNSSARRLPGSPTQRFPIVSTAAAMFSADTVPQRVFALTPLVLHLLVQKSGWPITRVAAPPLANVAAFS